MRTSTMELYDRATDGQLLPALRAMRAEGLSYDAIVDRLRDDLDVKVSRSTVARWISALDEPTEAAS